MQRGLEAVTGMTDHVVLDVNGGSVQMTSMSLASRDHTADRDDPLVDAVLSASRAAIAVAARSLTTAAGRSRSRNIVS